jgi:DNA ligase-1
VLPSLQVQHEFGLHVRCQNMDGELVAGDPTDYGAYNKTQSHVMSEDKPGDISFYAFDYIGEDQLYLPYVDRLARLTELCPQQDNLKVVQQVMVKDLDGLLETEELFLSEGYEGVIMRSPDAPYKQGRGTFREGIIYKLKRFHDAEAVIVGLEEGMTNMNEQERSELGYAKRSQSQDGLFPANTLGRFIVFFQGQEIPVAPGSLGHAERFSVWINREDYIGRLLKFRYFQHGAKDRPRFPRAVGIRSLEDM